MRKIITYLLCLAMPLSACGNMPKKDLSSTVKIGIIIQNGKRKAEVAGSGVAITEHTILTARHVVVAGEPLKIFVKDNDGKVYTAYISKISFSYDLALLEVPDAHFRPVKLAKRMPKIGERVYACGYPLALFASYTEGIVNHIEKGYIVHQAPIIFGNSGGPLFDRHGRLIGINVSMFTLVPSWAGNGVAEGIGHIKEFLDVK